MKGTTDKYVRAYFNFMVDAAIIFGANETNAKSELLDVLHFEIELAKVFKMVSSKFTIY